MPLLSILISMTIATSTPPARDAVWPIVAAAESLTMRAEESFSKLRKVHLVRPDLIAYPLVIDVVC